jgi:hypothetical protein
MTNLSPNSVYSNRVFVNNQVRYSRQVSLYCSFYFEGQFTTVCNMDFEKYPLDSQKCTLLFGSISQQLDVVIFDGQLTFNPKTQRTLQYDVSCSLTAVVLNCFWADGTRGPPKIKKDQSDENKSFLLTFSESLVFGGLPRKIDSSLVEK